MRMAPPAKFSSNKRKQEGYALVLVVFLTTLLLISVMAIAPAIRTERQREKEQEMIWRGKQYIRGIKLYYRKNGRFPTSIDDLTKPKVGSLRFMRKAYADPMNTQDGSWRLIYVGPAGQLIGSLKPQQNFQLPGVAGAVPAAAVGQQANSSAFGQSSFGQSSFGQSSFGGSTSGQGGLQAGSQAATQNGAQNTQPTSSTTGQGTNSGTTDDGSLPASAATSDSPIIGGNIIGVGSKVNKRSIIVYDKAKNYRLFEFIWNPSKDLANAFQQAGVPVANPNNPNQPGTNPPAGQGQGAGGPGLGPTGPNAPPNGPGMPAPTPPPDQPLQQPPQPQ
jgi:hypothetical protein